MSKIKVALGVMFGAVAGAVAGVLMAPKSGKETRADIKKKAHLVKDEADRVTKDVQKKAGEFAEDVKVKTEELSTRTGNAIEGAKEGFNKKTR